ncbi:class I SAM-dependent methyltransferase [Micromonospora echinofusca]|uniref:Methyltransferase domain-containing protein n=1 Tax=Micromonospora echinofusca TaxID=47858 RepID=A0ABS3W0R3_MICEH|nr:class I SAM-dependent methyltransferase [Micromonospora echinofusca]MBO4210382.1 methyltransferase domain-containing protein [Micromonospora echinofusca]
MADGTRVTAGEIVVTDARLRACLDEQVVDIGTLWELCMYFEFDRERTADDIARWLGPPAGQRILDCACGSGFPALELIQRGYDVTCTDGSEAMLRHFHRNARIEGLDVRAEQVLWEDLPKRYADQFDVVMNRGGGNYIYAGAWDDEGLATQEAMAEAIGQWIACLKPGGRFYVDITRAEDLERTDPQVSDHPTLLIGDHRVDILERIEIDRSTGIRTWSSTLTIDGVSHDFRRRCRFLRHDQLREILVAAGLTGVEKVDIPGEYYDIYSGVRA